MYDVLKCKLDLPSSPGEILFQTRDLKCLMYYYTIRTDGRLIYHEVLHGIVPEENRPYYGTKEWHSSEKARAAGSLTYKHDKNKYVDYVGGLVFYVLLDKDYYEYKATFIDNICEEIIKVERKVIPPWGLKGGEHLDTNIYIS